MTVTIDVSPSSPIAGTPVTFTITASDPDAGYMGLPGYDDGCYGDFGDGTHPSGGVCDRPRLAVACPFRYGPWTPPAKHSVQKTYTVTHTYSNAGSYQVIFRFNSSSDPNLDPCHDPYRNYREMSVTVNVGGAPVPTAT